MTVDAIGPLVASVIFGFLFASTVVSYVRRRTALSAAVVVVFATTAPAFIGHLVFTLTGFELPTPFAVLAAVGLLAQPLATLWLAAMLYPVPRVLVWLAVIGYVTTAVALLLLPTPSVFAVVGVVAVYATTALASATYFALAGRRRTGSARARLAIASAGSILMTATLLLGGASMILPSEAAGLSSAWRYGVLAAAACYAAAFVAPGWFRRIWQSRTGYDLSRALLSTSDESDPAITWLRFTELVAKAGGVRDAMLLIGNAERGARLLARVGATTSAKNEWAGEEYRPLLDQAVATHQVPSDRASQAVREMIGAGPVRYVTLIAFNAPRGQSGLLALLSDRRLLFARDDREMFNSLGVEAALLADRAQTASEATELAERLRTTNDQLRQANQAKSEFLANMSHELRTPLNAILGFIDMMRLEPVADDHRNVPSEWIDYVRVAGEHLLGLITDLLDLAKVEAGHLELRLEDVDPNTAVSAALAELRPLALQKDLTLTSEIDLPVIEADKVRMRQILYNLLSNAIKYTPQGGSVRVEGSADDFAVRISIVDSGVGIAAEDLDRVFESFTQVGDPQRRLAGTGLGLALTRRLVAAHGGTVVVESVVGVGSRFTVTMPRAQIAPGPAPRRSWLDAVVVPGHEFGVAA